MVARVVEMTDAGIDADRLKGLPHRETWIIADNLEIDHSYQRRRIRDAWVKEISDGFDPELFRPLLVNERRWDNNRLFVMDGQHRLLGIRRLGWGDQKLPCLLFDNLSYETEAKLFDTQGSSKPLTPQERFRSALERGEANEEIIDGLVRKAGYVLNLDNGDLSEGRIPGVGSLLTILRMYKPSILGEALEICRVGFGNSYGPRAPILVGVAKFLARYRNDEHFDARRLGVALRTVTLESLLASASDLKRVMSCDLTDAIGCRIVGAYNAHLRDDRRLPDWKFGRGAKADERKAA